MKLMKLARENNAIGGGGEGLSTERATPEMRKTGLFLFTRLRSSIDPSFAVSELRGIGLHSTRVPSRYHTSPVPRGLENRW